MATTTPNFGWPVPTSTDLVKDGATAIEALGDGIDTSMVDLKGGTTGQILAKATNADMDFSWITNDVGDITAVTAGTGISGGGTSGAVTITNSMATEITAKGDLIVGTGSATFDNLAAGSNGETLVADSSTSTGLRYNANFAAGKNAIINGDFRINQRAFTSITTDGTFGFDRWALGTAGGATYTPQTFTAGAAPVAGYEAINFAQVATTGQTATGTITILLQRIEDVRTFAGQTATVSFWAKATSGTPKIAVEMQQNFGSGGSANVNTYAGQITMTTSWVRYSVTVAVPSVSGKTIGTSSFLALQLWTSAGSDFNARTGSLGIQTATIGIWGVQVEAGSVATAFQTATGTIQGELAACQRYYWRQTGSEAFGRFPGSAIAASTTEVLFAPMLPVTMRTNPSATLDVGNIAVFDGVSVIAVTAAAIQSGGGSRNSTSLNLTVSGATQFRPYFVVTNNNAAGFIGYSAEL
jgi:hypothetical protein